MLYKPSQGIFKDNCVFLHEGTYYLFSMYSSIAGSHNDRRDYNHVWLATSADGVHWRDVGPVISAPFIIFAMGVWQVGGKFYLNHGSFTAPERQNVLRFWESDDLRTWTYRGEQTDLTPDARWYDPDSRFDCMDVISVDEHAGTQYYGVASGPGGWLRSADGVHWEGLPPATFEWGDLQPAGEYPFEIAGWLQIDDKLYLLGSRPAYAGNAGYCVFTLIGNSVRGPFRPDAAAYRLSGHSDRSIHLWARPCRAGDTLLASSYMYDGWGYRHGEVWLPPLKRFVLGDDGHLRLAYWEANEALKGSRIGIDVGQFVQCYPGSTGEARADQMSAVDVVPTETGIEVTVGPERIWCDHKQALLAVLMPPDELPAARGLVLEATVSITCKANLGTTSAIGLFLEEAPQRGTAVLWETCGRTRIGQLTLNGEWAFVTEDLIGPGCAPPQLQLDRTHRLRLLLRRNMFELYLDDMYVQTFNTSRIPGAIGTTPQRVGFVVQNGRATIEQVALWQMTLEE